MVRDENLSQFISLSLHSSTKIRSKCFGNKSTSWKTKEIKTLYMKPTDVVILGRIATQYAGVMNRFNSYNV